MDTIIINYNNNHPLKSKHVSYQPFILFNKHLYGTSTSLCERHYAMRVTNINSFPVMKFEIVIQTNLYCVTQAHRRYKKE